MNKKEPEKKEENMEFQTPRKNTAVIAGFPGTGKTWVFENRAPYIKDLVILDSDSSKFPKEGFPANYIEHIKENLGKADIIFVSTHEAVRKALIEEGISHIVIYPVRGTKSAYMERYKDRKSPDAFIKLMDEKWDDFITSIEELDSKYCTKIALSAGLAINNELPPILEFAKHCVPFGNLHMKGLECLLGRKGVSVRLTKEAWDTVYNAGAKRYPQVPMDEDFKVISMEELASYLSRSEKN